MHIRSLTLAATVAAFALTGLPGVVLPTAAIAANQECGYRNENGKLVFLGTCAHDTSDDSNQLPPAPPASSPCIGRLNSGPVVAHRLEFAGC